MARSLVLGNGNILVCYDEWGQVRDFYFPYVGLENHVGEKQMQRIGVFVDGAMHWLSSGEFEVHVTYERDELVGKVRAVHQRAGLELTFSDIVYNEHDIFVRHIEVRNTTDRDRNIKLFFNQQFHISESRHDDTGYYSPDLHALIHYKGRRVFLASARSADAFFEDYSVGLSGIEGKEGTWRDAEDGALSKSPIEHGSVDSVIGITVFVPAKSESIVHYWIAAARTYRRVEQYHRDILTRGPEHLRRTTGDYWKAWVHRKDFESCGTEDAYVDLYRRSLLVMRAHTDNRGAIIASGDSSILQSGRATYSFCWPRDAAYIVLAFLQAGHMTESEGFHAFCSDVLTDDGYLLHKYRSDKSLGSSWHPWVLNGRPQPPIQEDETAMTLLTLGEHYELTRDIELIERLYNPYIKRVADFLTKYRDRKTGLPLPSHDLWEERYGVFTYTASTVFAALNTAAHFADILGKHVAAKRWHAAALEVQAGMRAHLIADGLVAKSLVPDHAGRINDECTRDMTVDASSFYGLFKFGVLSVGDPVLYRAYERVNELLSVGKDRIGIARYEGDRYFIQTEGIVGNPWIITTLWLAEYELARAARSEDLALPRSRLAWVLAHATTAGLLAEQFDPRGDHPTSVTPLIWSHAQYVIVFNAYIKKLEELGLCVPTIAK